MMLIGPTPIVMWKPVVYQVKPRTFENYISLQLFLLGIWKWSNLRKEGLLKDDTLTAGEGWQRYWDEVTQTPWLFNPATKHFISYDDPQSLKIKVEHALCEDLAGVMVW